MDPLRNYSSWVEVDSSCLSRFIWFEDVRGTGILDVQIRVSGRIYRYTGVGQEVYRELLQAPSRGVYYNQEIKPNYSYRELHG